jgi:hypothetical protein
MGIYNVEKILEENEKLRNVFDEVSNVNLELRKEVAFLKERNKDLRQKAWFPVYEENLKLNEELEKYKFAITENCKLRKEIEIFKEVLISVQEFTKQFTE